MLAARNSAASQFSSSPPCRCPPWCCTSVRTSSWTSWCSSSSTHTEGWSFLANIGQVISLHQHQLIPNLEWQDYDYQWWIILPKMIRKTRGPMLALWSAYLLSFTKTVMDRAISSERLLTLSWYSKKSTAYLIRKLEEKIKLLSCF